MKRSVLVCLALTVAMRGADAQAPVPAPLADDEYAVWSVLLDTVFRGDGLTRHVVRDSTWAGGSPAALAADLRENTGHDTTFVLPEAALADFVAANDRSWPLEMRFRTHLPVQWTRNAGPPRPGTRHEGDAPVDSAHAKMLDAGFAGSSGEVSLSRPGFDPERRNAVVYVQYWCGPLCAGAQFVFFRRGDNGAWVATRAVRLWIS